MAALILKASSEKCRRGGEATLHGPHSKAGSMLRPSQGSTFCFEYRSAPPSTRLTLREPDDVRPRREDEQRGLITSSRWQIADGHASPRQLHPFQDSTLSAGRRRSHHLNAALMSSLSSLSSKRPSSPITRTRIRTTTGQADHYRIDYRMDHSDRR